MNTDVHHILQQAADQRVQKWQRRLKVGGLFYRTLNIKFNDREIEITLYCAITEVDGNMLTVKCLSRMNPSGEETEMHRATAQKKLSQKQFLAAAKRGWQ